MITGIVCVDNNWGIGKDNNLLFNIKEDMNYFKQNTMDKIVCMGYNTLLSFPNSKPLKNRTNIVLCPDDANPDNCIVYHDFNKLVNDIKCLSITNEVYIIGGAMFYKSMLPYYDKVLVTKVNANKDADTYFPNLDTNSEFTISNTSDIINTNNYNIQFVEYRRIKDED